MHDARRKGTGLVWRIVTTATLQITAIQFHPDRPGLAWSGARVRVWLTQQGSDMGDEMPAAGALISQITLKDRVEEPGKPWR